MLNADHVRSRAALLHYLSLGGEADYLFFWGPEKSASDEVGRGCLCQWYEAPFQLEGVHYPSAEHYMMAEKARLFGDPEMRERILATPNPALAKLLGRKVRHFDEQTWLHHRYAVVLHGTLQKFSQHPRLRDFLLATGGRVLVEASPVDPVWGVGLAQNDEAIADPTRWRGLNLLGFALMEARATLRSG